MIDLRPEHLALVQSLLHQHVPGCQVRAFGSRALGKAKPYSDLDLAVVGPAKLDIKVMARLKEAFEESDLPFRVDVLDWHAVPETFRENIAKGFEVIQEHEGSSI